MNGNHAVKFEPNIPVMLRDGTITYADVFRPDASGKFPAILQRTPYDKSASMSTADSPLDAIHTAMNGYAVVIQDVRGRYNSDGEFYTFINEIDDGYDSVEWVAGQPWCTGKVGHEWRVICWRHAVAGCQGQATLTDSHRTRSHRLRLPRRMGLARRRV